MIKLGRCPSLVRFIRLLLANDDECRRTLSCTSTPRQIHIGASEESTNDQYKHFTDLRANLTSRSNVPPKSVGLMPIQRSKAVQFGGKCIAAPVSFKKADFSRI